jgi:hypothetical protein
MGDRLDYNPFWGEGIGQMRRSALFSTLKGAAKTEKKNSTQTSKKDHCSSWGGFWGGLGALSEGASTGSLGM